MYKKTVVVFLTLLLFFSTSSTGFASNKGPVFIEEEVNNESNVFYEGTYIGTEDLFDDIETLGAVGKCDYKMSGYMFHSKVKYNGQVTKVLGSIGALLVSTRLPWLSKNQKTSVQIANTLNMGLGSTVYYTQDYYRMFAEIGKDPLPIAAEKTITRYYSDSSYTKPIDVKTHYNYTNWYCK